MNVDLSNQRGVVMTVKQHSLVDTGKKAGGIDFKRHGREVLLCKLLCGCDGA